MTLEDRYRSMLRLLPTPYRARWEEEMVATFLQRVAEEHDDPDAAEYDLEFGRPRLAEALSVAALAIRLHLGYGHVSPRSSLWGAGVRLVALVGLLVPAVLVPVGFVMMAWLEGWLPWPPRPQEVAGLGPMTWSAWEVLVQLLALLWVAAYLALVLGRRHAARVLAGMALVGWAAGSMSREGPLSETVLAWAEFAMGALPLLALAAFHRDAPPVRPRPWLVALAFGIALVLVPVMGFFSFEPSALSPPALVSMALMVAAVLHLAAPALGRARSPAWSLALALLAVPVLASDVLWLLRFAAGGEPIPVLAIAQALAVGCVAVALWLLALRELACHPASPAPTPPGIRGGLVA